MSVSTGLSSFVKSAPIFSATSRTSPMNVKVPRPYCAALDRKKELGAEPMPMVNRRRSATRWRMRSIKLAFVADCTVGEEHDLAHETGSGVALSARLRARASSRCRRAREAPRRTNAHARAVAGSAGIGAPNSARVTELNSITLKRSPGWRRSSAICSACFACLIEVPSIDPEVSMMNTASRGLRGASAAAGGGTIIASAYVLPSLCSAKSAAAGAAAMSGVH